MQNQIIKPFFALLALLFLMPLSNAYAKQPSGNGILLNQGNFSIYEGSVIEINPQARELTLKSIDGLTVFKAPQDMKNFDRIQIKDEVKVTLEVSVTIEKLPKSSSIRSKTLDTSQTINPDTAKPGKVISRKMSIESQILSKNREERYVVIKNLNYEDEKIQITRSSFFKQLKVGDTIKVSYDDRMKAIVSSRQIN
ncbi:hypothetical protein [Polynucleobacter kasalickyi]|uniref:DUF5666 domain-containing protein n=1 Tax=Polynucleobacter kasalickyi TaxID=1938817 RepID=A0A1W1ZU02_9BURK|nr:hypothetical protein [Polynucleobacter kasalickyi]SMC51857.1 hypothetical protein SAMN06296008_106124 [Polynucleobacter kasalickyi]